MSFFPLRTPCAENWTVHPCFFLMFCFVITILHHHLGKYLLPVPSIMAKHFQTTPMALDDRGATFRITQLCRATCQTPRRSVRFFYGKCPPFSPKKNGERRWCCWGKSAVRCSKLKYPLGNIRTIIDSNVPAGGGKDVSSLEGHIV